MQFLPIRKFFAISLTLFAIGCDRPDPNPGPVGGDDAGSETSEPASFAELLTFSVDPAATVEETLTLLDEIGETMATKDGFHHRYLGHDAQSDTWLILNYWDGPQAPAAANPVLQQLDASVALNGLIEPESVVFYNLDLKITPRDYEAIEDAGLIETVFYDTVAGVEEGPHIEKTQAVTELMYDTDGYYARTFARNAESTTPDGQTGWIAVNFWRDVETVEAANPILSGSEAGQAQIAEIDFSIPNGGISPTLTNFELLSRR